MAVLRLVLHNPGRYPVCFSFNFMHGTPPPGGLPQYTVAERVNAAPIVIEGRDQDRWTNPRLILPPSMPFVILKEVALTQFKSRITGPLHFASPMCA